MAKPRYDENQKKSRHAAADPESYYDPEQEDKQNA